MSEFRAQHSISEKYMKGGGATATMNHIIFEARQPGMAHRIVPWFEVKYVNHNFISSDAILQKIFSSAAFLVHSFQGTF